MWYNFKYFWSMMEVVIMESIQMVLFTSLLWFTLPEAKNGGSAGRNSTVCLYNINEAFSRVVEIKQIVYCKQKIWDAGFVEHNISCIADQVFYGHIKSSSKKAKFYDTVLYDNHGSSHSSHGSICLWLHSITFKNEKAWFLLSWKYYWSNFIVIIRIGT